MKKESFIEKFSIAALMSIVVPLLLGLGIGLFWLLTLLVTFALGVVMVLLPLYFLFIYPFQDQVPGSHKAEVNKLIKRIRK